MNTNDDLARALALAAGTDPYVICWRDLDPSSTQEELERLANWVTWAMGRYSLDHKVIPPCWPEHGALVEELSALRTFWEACYQEDAAPSDPVAFHRDLTLASAASETGPPSSAAREPTIVPNDPPDRRSRDFVRQ